MSQFNPEARFFEEAKGELIINDAFDDLVASSERFLDSAENFFYQLTPSSFDTYASDNVKLDDNLRATCKFVLENHNMDYSQKLGLITELLFVEGDKRSERFNRFTKSDLYGKANKDRVALFEEVADSLDSSSKPDIIADTLMNSYRPARDKDLSIFDDKLLDIHEETLFDSGSNLFIEGVAISSVKSAVYRYRKHR